MAADPRITNAVASSMADVIGNQLNSGTIRIYDGTIPANANTAVTSQTLLAELVFNSDAFPAASDGVLTANAITADSSANATGTAAWARFEQAGSPSVTVMDVTVGTSGEDINFNSVAFQAGAEVSITAMTITMPKT